MRTVIQLQVKIPKDVHENNFALERSKESSWAGEPSVTEDQAVRTRGCEICAPLTDPFVFPHGMESKPVEGLRVDVLLLGLAQRPRSCSDVARSW